MMIIIMLVTITITILILLLLTIITKKSCTYFAFESANPASNGSKILLFTISAGVSATNAFNVPNKAVRTVRSVINQSSKTEDAHCLQ